MDKPTYVVRQLRDDPDDPDGEVFAVACTENVFEFRNGHTYLGGLSVDGETEVEVNGVKWYAAVVPFPYWNSCAEKTRSRVNCLEGVVRYVLDREKGDEDG